MKNYPLFTWLIVLLITIGMLSCKDDNGESKLSKKAITNFTINSVDADIDESEKTIALTLPLGTDVTQLVPELEISENATVSPKSGEKVNFTKSVEYVVTAQDESFTVYTVNVNLEKSSQAKILSFEFSSLNIAAEIDEKSQRITARVPLGTDLTKLIPVITISAGASVNPVSDKLTDFSEPVEYTVIAQDGTRVKYTVTVTVAKSTEAKILDFGFSEPAIRAEIDENTRKISATLTFETDLTKLVPSITISAGAIISPEAGKPTDFTNPVEYTVTAQDGTTAKYTATIIALKSSEAKILSFGIPSLSLTGVIDEENHTITAKVASATDITALTPEFTISDKASVTPVSGELKDFTNPVEYTVTAQDGTVVKYTVIIEKIRSSEKEILSFDIILPNYTTVNAVIDKANYKITATVPFGTDIMNLKPVITLSDWATVLPASESVVDFRDEKVNFEVTAEDGSVQIYKVEVNIKPFVLMIESVNKNTVSAGDQLIIIGKFDELLGNTVILEDGVKLHILPLFSQSANKITANITPDIANGKYTLKVSANGSTVVYNKQVEVTGATNVKIYDVSAYKVIPGDEITITGVNFAQSGNIVTLVGANTVALTVVSQSATVIKATVPATAKPGEYKLRVKANAETCEFIQTITIISSLGNDPLVSSLDKSVDKSGVDQIIVTGQNFKQLQTPGFPMVYLYQEDDVNFERPDMLDVTVNTEGTRITVAGKDTDGFLGNYILKIANDYGTVSNGVEITFE